MKSTKKSVSKRIRITKNGKLVRRSMGEGHNHTHKTTKNLRNNKKPAVMTYPRKSFLSYSNK